MPQIETFKYHTTSERPAITYWYRVNRTLIDFSTGYTFTVVVTTLDGETTLITKTSGITGAAGSGTETDGTPNLTVTWGAGELAALTAGESYKATLTPTLTAGALDYEPVVFVLDMMP